MNFVGHMNTGIFKVNLTVLFMGVSVMAGLLTEKIKFQMEHTIVCPLLLAW